MKRFRIMRGLTMLASGAVMLQIAGCTTTAAFDFLQTAFLGVTAAGAIAILQNI